MWNWPSNAIYIPWTVWAVTWTVAAMWANRTVAGAGVSRQAPYRFFTTSGFVFLLIAFIGDRQPPGWMLFLFQRHWEFPLEVQWAMVGVATLGFLFCWWARIHLGALWSGRITRKEGHRVVDTGPYRLVRHPIYTGILLALLGSTMVHWYPRVVLLPVIFAYFVYAARVEERSMREHFPKEYPIYVKRTKMLIPFLL